MNGVAEPRLRVRRASARRRAEFKELPSQIDLDLSEYVPFLINRVAVALVARFAAEEPSGRRLNLAMWRSLIVLSKRGPLRQIDLSQATSVEASTLSRLVTRLCRMELVSRIRSDASNREVRVDLAPKGKALMLKLLPIAQALEQSVVDGLSKSELTTIKKGLRHMHQNMTQV